ncbi:sulfur carrier protein ThiS [Thiospirochaeta perfilievii]|uniref:Sulfur carrier protein ThiS n=1 Tax=Thiospirochaeta perfilievii TaxID=252967 RepID=A0A5C1QEQ5_9SPIO|nr:sulfur carrier protein ThiS [Thiospirochaeta perfilievii]QEN05868.1 sulfur carrier protein ThiS [Thiospirochaeta perfilievii]
MKVTINGKKRDIDNNLSILELLKDLKVDPNKIIIQLNQEIIKSKHFESTSIIQESQIEILSIVGGG